MPQKAKNLTARLSAVQALYQASQNKQNPKTLVEEYLSHRSQMEIEGEEMVQMNGALFKKIVQGAFEHSKDLLDMINAARGDKANQPLEPLLKSTLMCGTYELMAHDTIDAPIIINDYLNIAHGFYNQSEVNLINGILDTLAKKLRG